MSSRQNGTIFISHQFGRHRSAEMACDHRLRQADFGRNGDGAIQGNNRPAFACPFILRSADIGCSGRCRSQPNARMCTPEIRSLPDNNGHIEVTNPIMD